jgi:FHA domain
VQTEDSGLDKPHIITHLFADGGRIIKSHKRNYADAVNRPDVSTHVRALMKGQQLEMALMLREGAFDEIIAGRAMGGMQVLTEPPKADLQKLATQKAQRVAAAAEASQSIRTPLPVASPVKAGDAHVASFFRLHVARALGKSPAMYAPTGPHAIIGSAGAIDLPGEPFCHPREATITAKNGQLWLEDLEGGNGVFLRIRAPVALDHGDEFAVGDQLLRVERNPEPTDGPGEGPTYFASSPQWVSSFRVVQVFVGGALGACVLARGTTLHIGSVFGDFILPGDPLISEQHCYIEEQAGDIVLTDYGSGSGVFVRIKGEQELLQGDEIMVGRTRLIVEKC